MALQVVLFFYPFQKQLDEKSSFFLIIFMTKLYYFVLLHIKVTMLNLIF